jgi:flagellar motor switch protein FliN/FliY
MGAGLVAGVAGVAGVPGSVVAGAKKVSAPAGGSPMRGQAALNAAGDGPREFAQGAAGSGDETNQALVPAPRFPQTEEPPGFGPLVGRLPVEVDVAVPVREFRVRHLLALEPGAVIESEWNHGSDLPLAAGDVRLAWSEFEVVETKLAVRVTRLE